MERAVAFDAMGTLFDVAPIERRFGVETMPRLVHAAAALTLAGGFVPFPELVEALLGAEAREAFAELDAFPDAREALEILARAEIRAIVLTNGSAENTRTLLERNRLQVELVVTTEEAQAYKPHPAPYRLSCEQLDLPSEQVTLVAAHAWDCYGALAAGLDTVLVDRAGTLRWPFPAAPPSRVPSLAASASWAARRGDR